MRKSCVKNKRLFTRKRVVIMVGVLLVLFVYGTLQLSKRDSIYKCLLTERTNDKNYVDINFSKKLFEKAGYTLSPNSEWDEKSENIGYITMFKIDKKANQIYKFYVSNQIDSNTNKVVSHCNFETRVLGSSTYKKISIKTNVKPVLNVDKKVIYNSVDVSEYKSTGEYNVKTVGYAYNTNNSEVLIAGLDYRSSIVPLDINFYFNNEGMDNLKVVIRNYHAEIDNLTNNRSIVKKKMYDDGLKMNIFENQSISDKIYLCSREEYGEYVDFTIKEFTEYFKTKQYKIRYNENNKFARIEKKIGDTTFDVSIINIEGSNECDYSFRIENKTTGRNSNIRISKKGLFNRMMILDDFEFIADESYIDRSVFYNEERDTLYFYEYKGNTGNVIYDFNDLELWKQIFTNDLSIEEVEQNIEEIRAYYKFFYKEYDNVFPNRK